MKIRIKVSISGSRNGEPWPKVGEEIEVPDMEGADLCAAGIADPVATKDKTEKAVKAEATEKRSPGRPRKTKADA